MTEVTNRVDATPTKHFFVHMLTRDIKLEAAIVDLVDNSIDGAVRLRGKQGDFTGLFVSLEVNSSHFSIVDNCGGIPVEVAQNYAFRFGRPADAPVTEHSLGRYGVGMKRALFKIGSRFTVRSTAETSQFELTVDVARWLEESDNWSFELSECRTDLATIPVADRGTVIRVEELDPNVAKRFCSNTFLAEIAAEIRNRHALIMEQGIVISLNGIPIQVNLNTLLQSDTLRPIYRKREFDVGREHKVHLSVYAGVSKSDVRMAGWYIYCNGRMILGPDQTDQTGWGADKPASIPRFHPQYSRFRGFAFFNSADPALLPWNTTKTGVDADSPIFLAARAEMIDATRPVINFLNDLDRELDEPSDRQHLRRVVERAEARQLNLIPEQETFQRPRVAKIERGPQMGTIQFKKPQVTIEMVKEVLGVTTNKEAGEATFDYFVEVECPSE